METISGMPRGFLFHRKPLCEHVFSETKRKTHGMVLFVLQQDKVVEGANIVILIGEMMQGGMIAMWPMKRVKGSYYPGGFGPCELYGRFPRVSPKIFCLNKSIVASKNGHRAPFHWSHRLDRRPKMNMEPALMIHEKNCSASISIETSCGRIQSPEKKPSIDSD